MKKPVVNYLPRLLSVACSALWLSPMTLAEDLLIEDFESGSYAQWTLSGEAFGEQPAKGTLPNQHPVSGFRGFRLPVSGFWFPAETRFRFPVSSFRCLAETRFRFPVSGVRFPASGFRFPVSGFRFPAETAKPGER